MGTHHAPKQWNCWNFGAGNLPSSRAPQDPSFDFLTYVTQPNNSSCTPKRSSKTTNFPVPEFQRCIGRGRSRIGHRGYYFAGGGAEARWRDQVLSKERPATTLWWHFFQVFSAFLVVFDGIWSTTPEIICHTLICSDSWFHFSQKSFTSQSICIVICLPVR